MNKFSMCVELQENRGTWSTERAGARGGDEVGGRGGGQSSESFYLIVRSLNFTLECDGKLLDSLEWGVT